MGKPTKKLLPLPDATLCMQFNQSGAWRNAVTFNAKDKDHATEVMFYGAMLASCSGAKARVVTTDGMQTAIASWDQAKGWCDSKSGRALQ